MLSALLKPSPIDIYELNGRSRKAPAPVKTKNVRGRSGRLAIFLTMPLDVFYEVARA